MGVPQIGVIYLDGTVSSVARDVLDVLIATGRIRSFKRDGLWVDVAAAGTRLRDYRQNQSFDGPERRAPWQGPPDEPQG